MGSYRDFAPEHRNLAGVIFYCFEHIYHLLPLFPKQKKTLNWWSQHRTPLAIVHLDPGSASQPFVLSSHLPLSHDPDLIKSVMLLVMALLCMVPIEKEILSSQASPNSETTKPNMTTEACKLISLFFQ